MKAVSPTGVSQWSGYVKADTPAAPDPTPTPSPTPMPTPTPTGLTPATLENTLLGYSEEEEAGTLEPNEVTFDEGTTFRVTVVSAWPGFAGLVLMLTAGASAQDAALADRDFIRLRLYSKIMDPPGEAKPDWWIIAQVAKRMGYEGFDWRDSNDVFEEAAERSKGGVHDYAALVEIAREQGKRGHELLRELGMTGIQCPMTREGDRLVGTERLHQDSFSTASGKAIFPKGDWNNVKPFQNEFAPQGDELWVTNMRVNEHWQSQFDDHRIPYRWQRFPVNFPEINPSDAGARGIESGD